MIEALSAALPVAFGAAIGYVFGTMRDWSKSKAERSARYQDQVLEAASGLLSSTHTIVSAATELGLATTDHEWHPEGTSEAEAEDHKIFLAMTRLSEALEGAKPHTLRISILAPHLATLADKVVETASYSEIGTGSDTSIELLENHAKATEDFTDAVRAYLKVPRRKH